MYKLYTLDNKFLEETFYIPSSFIGIFVNAFGDKAWYFEQKYHRLDGPAIEWNSGAKEWYVNGKRHRLDGPAIEYCYDRKSWWFENTQVTEESLKLLIDMMKLKGLL